MSVVKFEATVDNGNIVIPIKFREKIQGKVEVIVHFESESKNEEEPFDIISELMKNPLHISDPKPLTRDEIYDRT